jgi:RNA polymerase-binding transcription factor DksA
MEERLLEERDRTLRGLRTAEAEESEPQHMSAGELSRVPTHMADAASDIQEEEKDFANITRLSEQLARIDEALDLLRKEPDKYQVCSRCGNPIESERLELVPWTRVCAADAD